MEEESKNIMIPLNRIESNQSTEAWTPDDLQVQIVHKHDFISKSQSEIVAITNPYAGHISN